MVDTQYVIFRLGEELYGAAIHDIQEIMLPQTPTMVPNNPGFIEGIIDYRDKVIPVLDLKKRFRLGTAEYEGQSRFVIAEVNGNNVAFAVDEVTEILRTQKEDIEEVPELTRISKEYIYGATHLDGKLIVLLELSKVLTVEEQDLLESINSD
ncbi:MAG: purine-binding chemotaxis protein CheW [Clostridiales bacterium]|nr:purine-binding chemotaxis protein CheW [Clostridiales bacterium]